MIEYSVALAKQNREKERYRNYVTDALKLITENTAKSVAGEYIPVRFFEDKISKKKEKPQKTSKEIINNISSKITNIGKS